MYIEVKHLNGVLVLDSFSLFPKTKRLKFTTHLQSSLLILLNQCNHVQNTMQYVNLMLKCQ